MKTSQTRKRSFKKIAFSGFYNEENSLPNFLKTHSYETEFLTNSTLEFSNTGNWAKSIGFSYVEGNNHPYYNDKEKFHFDAAADEFLYDRIFDRINKNKDKKLFLFAKTVSTHAPFFNPRTKKEGEPEAFKYSDKQIYKFYNKLKKDGFFKNGMLLILGDHHTMKPPSEREIEVFGETALLRVPFIIIDGKHKLVSEEIYQQMGTFNGIRNLLSDKECHTNWIGDVFEQINPKYILHRNLDRKSLKIVTKDDTYQVNLDGEKIKIENKGKQLDPKTEELILDKVHSVIIETNKNFKNQIVKTNEEGDNSEKINNNNMPSNKEKSKEVILEEKL